MCPSCSFNRTSLESKPPPAQRGERGEVDTYYGRITIHQLNFDQTTGEVWNEGVNRMVFGGEV